jgi:transposase-like protein
MWIQDAGQTRTRRQWTAPDKIRIVVESWQPGASANSVARRHHISPNLIFRWRRLVRQGLLGDRALQAFPARPQPAGGGADASRRD